jgi:membrane protease YdiL (CAAX protease family)
MWAALPAFLLEAVFYLGSIFQETRAWLAQFRPARMQAAFLWFSALAPYLIFSLSAGTFERNSFYLLAGLTAVLSFWYVLLPRRPAYDIGFLVIAAAPLVSRVFARIYRLSDGRPPDEHVQADILGHLMWIRLGIAALLVLREWNPGAFGFWPRSREWRIGTLYYLISIIPVVLLAVALHDVRFELRAGPWWQVAGIGIGTLFGILWVVALSEELFFRGVIERAMLDRSRIGAVLVSAILYGSAHLWVHQFPNWRRAAVGTLLGVVFGILYAQTGSVRAPMVTHALVVATWRVFFK